MSSRLALLCLLLFAGCIPPGSQNGPKQSPRTLQFLRVTEEVPAFGGLARENGQWVIFLFDFEQRAAAETRLRDIFGEEATQMTVRARAPRGNASEEMMNTAGAALGVPGIGRLDFDETNGYLRVGLVDVEATEPVQLKLDEHGIPRDQVIIEVVRPIVGL
jgi:hypothetical protein